MKDNYSFVNKTKNCAQRITTLKLKWPYSNLKFKNHILFLQFQTLHTYLFQNKQMLFQYC